MSAMAFQITGVSMVCSTVRSGADQIKHQKLRVTGLNGDRWTPITKCQWHGKWFHLMTSSYKLYLSSWASCQIRKIAGAHAPGMPGTFSPPPQVSDPDMHHGTHDTHVPWCMPGSLTNGFLRNRRWGKTFPAFPVHAQTAILRIW